MFKGFLNKIFVLSFVSIADIQKFIPDLIAYSLLAAKV
jgi:hypothetical protein